MTIMKFFTLPVVHCTASSKGHLISEHTVLNSPKMQRNITRISALAYKLGQIIKVKAHYHPN